MISRPDKLDRDHDHAYEHRQIEPVARRQQHRLTADHTAELAVGNHRAGKGQRADSDTDIDLDFMDGFLDPGVLDRRVHEIGETDQYRGEPDQAVQDRDQFRHLRHLHPARQDKADNAADDHDADKHLVVRGDECRNGHYHRDNHTDDAEQVAATRGNVGTQTAECEDEQRRGAEIGNGNQAGRHRLLPLEHLQHALRH